MKRREFIKTAGTAGFAAGTCPASLMSKKYVYLEQPNLSQIEASFYEKHPDREIKCLLCPRFCKLGDKERGYCGVRENRDGIYYTLVYGKACTVQIDPIEKKPFFHFLPGERTLSFATAGCNVNCKFCQNWEISQVRPEQIDHFDFPPDQVISAAQKNRCPIIAYTYSEPIVFYEYMYDTSMKAQKNGIKNVVVTGGHINPEPLIKLIGVVDGIKVDLKAFTQDFYTDYVRGELKPVLEAIKIIAKSDVWLEIVYLVIPSLNDHPDKIRRLSDWLIEAAGPSVPIHFSRFHPMYLLKNLPPTPLSTLEKAWETARQAGLQFVYIGNVPGHPAENTYCPKCEQPLIKRNVYAVTDYQIKKGKCTNCGCPIPGVWS